MRGSSAVQIKNLRKSMLSEEDATRAAQSVCATKMKGGTTKQLNACLNKILSLLKEKNCLFYNIRFSAGDGEIY